MKIFITGVAGFLGSHLADRFIELGHKVAGNDNLIGGYRDNVNPQVLFYDVDCRDRSLMQSIIQGYDIVVHCAATAHEGLSVFSPSFITSNIYEASVSVISASISAGVKRFVYCSSMARYGEQESPFTEDMPTSPVDPYGIAKVAAEQTLKTLCDVHDMEWNIAVPHNIIGPRQRYDDPYRNVVSIMANRNLRGLPSYIYGDGKQLRCFSYVSDCINCLEKLALDESIIYEVVNIGPDENPVSINETAILVASACGVKHEPIHIKDRPKEVKYATCSSDKARELLNYKTEISLSTAIKETVDYIKQKGPKEFDYSFGLEIQNEKTPETWKNKLL